MTSAPVCSFCYRTFNLPRLARDAQKDSGIQETGFVRWCPGYNFIILLNAHLKFRGLYVCNHDGAFCKTKRKQLN